MIATEEASTPEEAGKNKKKKVAVNIFWLKITNVVQVTMEKMIKMQKARKEEKPVAMLIKGGMLFKDGKTTEEKKVGLPSSFFNNILFLFLLSGGGHGDVCQRDDHHDRRINKEGGRVSERTRNNFFHCNIYNKCATFVTNLQHL